MQYSTENPAVPSSPSFIIVNVLPRRARAPGHLPCGITEREGENLRRKDAEMRYSLLLPAMSVAAALNGPQTAILRAPSQVGLRADLRAMAMAAEWEEYAG